MINIAQQEIDQKRPPKKSEKNYHNSLKDYL